MGTGRIVLSGVRVKRPLWFGDSVRTASPPSFLCQARDCWEPLLRWLSATANRRAEQKYRQHQAGDQPTACRTHCVAHHLITGCASDGSEPASRQPHAPTTWAEHGPIACGRSLPSLSVP